MKEYTNSEITALIDDVIHKERDRAIIKRRLCDGTCYEPLAEEFGISVRHCKRIVYQAMDKISKRMK